MKKLFLLMAMIILPMLANTVVAGSNSGDFIFSLGHKGVQGKDHILFDSFATEDIAEGQKASLNWSLNKLDKSFSILVDGNPVSTNLVGNYDFYPLKSTEVTISLFDNDKNKVIEEHDHFINVYGTPKITSLTADREIAKADSNVILRWTGENLGTVSFSPAAVAVNAGSAIVRPLGNTTYVMTATNPIGLFDTREVTIRTSDYIPEITSFVTDKAEVYRGQAVELTWTSKDSESVDFFIDGVEVKKGLPANGSFTYEAVNNGKMSLQLRAKDKYYGLYGQIKEKALEVKESTSWDYLPRLKKDRSIKVGQSLDFEWASGIAAKSISVSYKTDNATDWTVLPITSLSGSYSLPINDALAKTATVKFDLIKSNDSLVTASIVGSLIKTSINETRFDNGGLPSIKIEQGVNYPVYIYVNGVQNRAAYNGDHSIPLGNVAGEYVVDVRTGSETSSVIDTYRVTMLPSWIRTPDLSRSVMYAGDDTVLSWSAPAPFTQAFVKRVSNLGESSFDRLPASGTLSDKLLGGESYVNYTVTLQTTSGEKLSSSVSSYLAKSNIAISEASFGQEIPVAFLSSTPGKTLYVDGVLNQSLSGTSYNVSGLSVGTHTIEIKSSFGKFPENNRVYSKEINVLPSINIEIQSDFVVVEVGKMFNWSWYVPEQYDNIEVLETKASQALVSSEREGTYSSLMNTSSGSTLTIKASSNGGAVTTKTFFVNAIYVNGVNAEYNNSENITAQVFGPTSVYINGNKYTTSWGSSSSYTATIAYQNLNIGVNEVRFVSTNTRSGQKMDVVRTVTRLNNISLSIDNAMALAGGITGASWRVPDDFNEVKLIRRVGSVNTTVSINKEGHHSGVMPGVAVTYMLSAKTLSGKEVGVSAVINYYTVSINKEADYLSNTAVKITSNTNDNFVLSINGSDIKTMPTSSGVADYSIGYTSLKVGKNDIQVRPSSSSGMKFVSSLSRLQSSKNPNSLDYAYGVIGKKVKYLWDVTTEYSVVKVMHNGNIVSTENSGEYEFTKNATTESLSIYTETPNGYSITRSLTSYPITVSATKEITSYQSASTQFYAYNGAVYGYGIYINDVLWDRYTANYSSGKSISASLLKFGDNEIRFVPDSGSIMPWTTTIKKLVNIGASSNYDVALVGTKIDYNWDIPDEYTTFKIESRVKNVTTVINGSRKDSFSHIKSDGYTDALIFTATNANGAVYSETVSVHYLKITPRADRITGSETYFLDVKGSFTGAKVYINDALVSNIGSLGNLTYSFGSFLTEQVNEIKYVPNGVEGRVTPWSRDVVAFKAPTLTSDYDYIAPTDTATYHWSADDSLYETVTLTHNKSTGAEVISTDKAGTIDTIKVMSDSVSIRAVTYTGEVYNNTLTITDFDTYVSASHRINYQGMNSYVYYRGSQYNVADTVDYYINGVKYSNITYIASGSASSYSYRSGHIGPQALNDGDNEIKVVYTGNKFSRPKDFYVSIEKKPEMTISKDYDAVSIGHDITFNWTVPDVYTNVVVTLNGAVVSNDSNGQYVYTPTISEYVYLRVTAKTAEGSTSYLQKDSFAYNVDLRPYSNVKVDSHDIEIAQGHPPKVIYETPKGTAASIYVNGVKRVDLASNASAVALDSAYFNKRDNTIEIFTNDSLTGGLPSEKHLYFKGTVTMFDRATISTVTPYVISDNAVKYTWNVPEEYDSVEVKTRIGNTYTTISTEKTGEFESIRSKESTDMVYLYVKRGDISYTTTGATYAAQFSIQEGPLSIGSAVALNYALSGSSTATNVNFDIYVNGQKKSDNAATWNESYQNYEQYCSKRWNSGYCYEYSHHYVTRYKAVYHNTGAVSLSSSWFVEGENEVEIRYHYASYPEQIWKNKIIMVKRPTVTADNRMIPVGEDVTYTWKSEPEYTDVKLTLSLNGVTNVISTENNGSYTFAKTKGTDNLIITASGDNGLSYSTSLPVYYMDVKFPSVVPSDKDVSYQYASSYPGANVFVNGVLMRPLSLNTGYSDSPSFFIEGENTIEVVQTASYASQSKKWTGKLTMIAAPEIGVNYNMAPIGERISVNWNASSNYSNVSVKLVKASGTEVLLGTNSSGTASYTKESGADKITISAVNYAGEAYEKTIDVHSVALTFPSMVASKQNVTYQYASSYGSAILYVNDVQVKSFSSSSSYVDSASHYQVGENTIRLVPTGLYASSSKVITGKVTVMPPPELDTSYSMVHIGDVVSVNWDASSYYDSVKVTLTTSSGTEVISGAGNKGQHSYIKESGNDTVTIVAYNSSGAAIYQESKTVKYMAVLFPATVQKGNSATYSVQSSSGVSTIYLNGVSIKTISVASNIVYTSSISNSLLNVGDNIIQVVPQGDEATTGKQWVGKIIVIE